MRRIFKKISAKRSQGFTLVEMLIVAPLIVLVIATIVGFLLGLVGDTLFTNTRTQAVYDVQGALTQIERDTFLATQFMSSYTPHSPQGKDDSVGTFNTSTGDIIINQYGTTSDPTDTTRTIVYYANQPQTCAGLYQNNPPFFVKAIYFLKSQPDGTSNLYRRTVVPLNNTNTGSNINGDTTCTKPWQRSSCTVQNLSDPRCQARDILLLTGVTSLTSTYYNKVNPTVPLGDPTVADSLRVTISVKKSVAGKIVTQTSSIASSRTNTADPTPQLLGTPVISVLNPSSTVYNNPILATFQWSATNATQYTYTYKIDSGSWSTPVTTANTNVGITTPYSHVTITLNVTVSNDNGSSTTQFVYTTPVWTDITLLSGWAWWGGGHTHPQYTLTTAGLLVMKGMLHKGTGTVTSDPLFTLPVGLAPSVGELIFPVTSSTSTVLGPGRVDVDTSGNVYIVSSGDYFLSLDTVNFYPRGRGTATAISMPTNGWTNYATGYSPLYYYTDSTIVGGSVVGSRVTLQGLANRNGSTNYTQVLGAIPANGTNSHHPILGDAGSGPMIAGTNISSVAGERVPSTLWASFQATYFTAAANPYWNTIAFAGDWHLYGSTWAVPAYIKSSDNVVTLRGLAAKNSASNGETIFTLPSGYRPAETLFALTYTYSATINPPYGVLGVIYINPDGTVTAYGASLSNVWASLENISFYADGN